MALALEQLGADVFLQQAKLPRHRRLHQVEQLGGTGDVAGVGDGQEGAQLLEVHGGPAR